MAVPPATPASLVFIRTSVTEPRRPRLGFSLTELLVVIGIIALLVGILLVALGKVQVKARRTQTESVMQQVMNAANTFHEENLRYPGVIPEVVLATSPPQISSTENMLLDLLGGFRVLQPTDIRTAGNAAFDSYETFRLQAVATSSLVGPLTWATASGDWDLVIDTRKIGEGPVINGKPHAPYFTPGASDIPKLGGHADLPELADAWGQPILYLRQLRERGPLVAPANNAPAPQFLRGGLLMYIQATSLGELAKDQSTTSILSTAPDTDATLAKMLMHAAIDNQAKGGMCLISAGPDGVYYSRFDGPGSNSTPIDDIVTNGTPEFNNIKVVDDYDDVRVFGGG
ncbi:MAG TPA: prepilin-type N-terminal cleavage/methylation domain-containing protein [Phycisphaerales bacterium]|nr:prepilin-type N-terminal cleavage/methylation domain-containing protein [Phycisphaerales bacterium]